ncbi:MAG: rod shape-determining protein, partial [Bacteroidales bacterium]|nr:rod shape-determining protein [Bacteroidales bacterium]
MCELGEGTLNMKLRTVFYKCVKKACNLIEKAFFYVKVQILFFLLAVEHFDFSTNGCPIVNVRKGRMSIGKKFRMNNSLWANTIGFATPCVLVADNAMKDMTIRISRKKLRALAVDLGTFSTLFALPDEGIILREASVAAADEQGRIVAAGNDALLHFKRAPEKRTILHPLRDGTVFDVSLCREMLAGFVDRTFGKTARRLGLNAVLCIPASFGTAAFAAAEEAANGAGLRVIRVIQTPVAAALGAQLSIDQPEGHMVLDIGGSSTCAAVLTLGGIAMQRTAHTGGRHIDHAIMQYM